MNDFSFQKPASLAAAVEAMKARPDGKLLGGGQSLLPVMKLGLAAPTDLVALAAVPELSGIRVEGGDLVVGAGCTHAEVAESPEVKKAIPALAGLAAHIGDAQVRNRGTLGGSLAHADPAADYPAAVVALGATIVTDRRELPADGFFQGLYTTALQPDEVIVRVKFPVPERAGFAKFPHPASRFALVGVFAAKGPKGVRLAVTGAGPSVFRLEAFEKALAGRWAPDALAGLEVSADGLNQDPLGSPEYRAHLVGVMARRAVESA